MHNILGLPRPGGLFMMAALRRCRGYAVGPRNFPSAGIDEYDVECVLALHGYGAHERHIEVARFAAGPLHGHEGIVLVAAGLQDQLLFLG
jgi:hypothetical protein